MKNIYLVIAIYFITDFEVSAQNLDNKISTSELIINSTIRIECYHDTIVNGQRGTYTSKGTGFYFMFKIDSLSVPVIVTNYHVVKNADSGKLTFTELIDKKPKYGRKITESIPNFENCWIKHPNVDLAILPINPLIDGIKRLKNKIPFIIYYSEDLLPSKNLLEEVSAIEDVFMIGYPSGFWDEKNNLPIVRKGITATPIYLNYNDRKEFLLDIPNFGGSSGSPIVLYNQGAYSGKNGGVIVGGRIALLGINVSYWKETATNFPINIATIIKSEELLGFKPILKNLIASQKRK